MYLSLVHGGLHTPGRQRHVQRPDRHLQTVLHLDRQRPRLPLTVAPAAALLPLPPGAGVPSTAPRLIAVVLLGCLCQLLLQSLLCCCSAQVKFTAVRFYTAFQRIQERYIIVALNISNAPFMLQYCFPNIVYVLNCTCVQY